MFRGRIFDDTVEDLGAPRLGTLDHKEGCSAFINKIVSATGLYLSWYRIPVSENILSRRLGESGF